MWRLTWTNFLWKLMILQHQMSYRIVFRRWSSMPHIRRRYHSLSNDRIAIVAKYKMCVATAPRDPWVSDKVALRYWWSGGSTDCLGWRHYLSLRTNEAIITSRKGLHGCNLLPSVFISILLRDSHVFLTSTTLLLFATLPAGDDKPPAYARPHRFRA